jgi:hypothetical protein
VTSARRRGAAGEAAAAAQKAAAAAAAEEEAPGDAASDDARKASRLAIRARAGCLGMGKSLSVLGICSFAQHSKSLTPG